MNGHCGRYDLSVKCTLKSKQSQPSPPTLATESYGYALTGRVECLSANHPPVAPLRLQAYRDTARSLGYPLAVVSLIRGSLACCTGPLMNRTGRLAIVCFRSRHTAATARLEFNLEGGIIHDRPIRSERVRKIKELHTLQRRH